MKSDAPAEKGGREGKNWKVVTVRPDGKRARKPVKNKRRNTGSIYDHAMSSQCNGNIERGKDVQCNSIMHVLKAWENPRSGN